VSPASPLNEAESPVTSAEGELAAAGPAGNLRSATPAVPETAIELIDLTELATPDLEIIINPGSFRTQSSSLTLREDNRGVIVDIVRRGPLDEPLTLRLEEVGFSGNRSPWRSGQFEISNGGYVEFPRDEERARVTLVMASDTRREADQVSTLRVREVESAAIALATVELVLEDDDQRRFEAELPANTVAFRAGTRSGRADRPCPFQPGRDAPCRKHRGPRHYRERP
jgi:hypothetical protein